MLVLFSAPVQVLNVHTLQLADPSIAAKLVFPSVSRRGPPRRSSPRNVCADPRGQLSSSSNQVPVA